MLIRKTCSFLPHSMFRGAMLLLTVLTALAGLFIANNRSSVQAQTGGWPAYMGDIGRTGFNGAETSINSASAPHLKLHWKSKAGGQITSQPVEAFGLVYWGSWNGTVHATNPTTGQDVWITYVGQSASDCNSTPRGVMGSLSTATMPVGHVSTPVVLVPGGDVSVYALNAATGTVIWQTQLGTAPDYFLYDAPAYYKGKVYVGVSSHGDCPLSQGKVVELKSGSGAIDHTFDIVPSGCSGGGVWVAPTIDKATGMLYVGTGNQGQCSTPETMTDALVELNSANLSYAASWQIPASQQMTDGDFGSTSTLFTATIDGVLHKMIGLLDKNGIFYAFDRTNISAGPLWQVRVAFPGIKNQDSVSSAAWDGSALYIAAASTTINGAQCAGSLRALDPASGNFLWGHCLSTDVYGPVTAVPGLAEVGSGQQIILVDTTNGTTLFSFQDSKQGSQFEGAGSISNGTLYHGNLDGYLYAIGT